MLKKNKLYLLLLTISLLTSCSDKSKDSTLAEVNSGFDNIKVDDEDSPESDRPETVDDTKENVEEIEVPEEVTESGETPVENENSNNPTEIEQKIFYFSHELGECLNNKDEKGYNFSLIGECGDISNQNVSDVDLTNKTLYGLNIKGTSFFDSKFKFKNIADKEMRVSSETFFDKVKNPFTRLFDSHILLMEREASKAKKYKQKKEKLKKKVKAYRVKVKEAKNKSIREKIRKKIAKIKLKLKEANKNIRIGLNKRVRHRRMAREVYKYAKEEDAYTNPKIKNKKSLELDGKVAYQGASSFVYFPNDEFTISVWFRTIQNQNDKRIINFHHKTKQESAINIMVRNNKIVCGYRDEYKKYKELSHTVDYATNDWFHVAVSFDGETYRLFINGSHILTKEDSFSRFGSFPLTIGSYDGKSRFFTGSIDELSIWSKKLRKGAIKSIYNEGNPTNLKRHISSRYLVNWWRLGDKLKKKDSTFRGVVDKTQELIKTPY